VEFKKIVMNRYSCRAYQDKKVPEETIRELLEMIVYSASAINLQPWRIRVVSDPELKAQLRTVAFDQPHVESCSHLLVLCADSDYAAIIAKFEKSLIEAEAPEEVRNRLVGMAKGFSSGMTPEQQLTWSQNQVHIAVGNAINGAYSLGLASCPMTAFEPAEFSRMLELPAHIVPTVLVAVGYPADEFMGKMRYPLEEVLI